MHLWFLFELSVACLSNKTLTSQRRGCQIRVIKWDEPVFSYREMKSLIISTFVERLKAVFLCQKSTVDAFLPPSWDTSESYIPLRLTTTKALSRFSLDCLWFPPWPVRRIKESFLNWKTDSRYQSNTWRITIGVLFPSCHLFVAFVAK